MSNHTLIQKRFGTWLFVLLYVLATTLPYRPAGAAVAAGPCGDTGFQPARIAAGLVPAAGQQVTIPKVNIDSAVFEAIFVQRYEDAEKVAALFEEYLVLSGDSRMPWDKILEEYTEKFRKAITPADLDKLTVPTNDEILHTAFEVTQSIPEVRHLVPAIWKKVADVGNSDSDAFSYLGASAATGVSASAWRWSLAARMLAQSSEILAQAHDCAQKDPAYALLFDQRHSKKLNASILDGALKVLENNPDVYMPSELRGRISPDGTITISLDELTQWGEAEFEKLHVTIDDIRGTLVEIDQKQDVIVDYIQDQQTKELMQALAKKKAAEHKLNLDASKASMSIIATLLNQIDPILGKSFSVVAASSLQVGMALNDWVKATSGLNGLDKVTSLSTVVMTGNVLGAVMNVMNLFGPNKPTPEQMILKEIGKLRQQVDTLRTEMHSRFDRIDAGLNTIYTTMGERFDQVDIQLGRINGKLDEVQQSLLELDLKLSRIEHNNFEMLNALGRRPLLEAINGGLNYEETTGVPMPYQPQFIDFANLLYTWGTLHAFDALEAGPSQTDYSDGNVLAVLNAYGTDTNINYLNGWLMARGAPPIANKRLASPRDWLLASRAFTQLGIEWPAHIGRYDAQRQIDLDKVGADLEAAMLNISTLSTPTGPQGNHLLFDAVIANYQTKLGSLVTAIESAVETPFVQEVLPQRLHKPMLFDLYGGIDQPLPYESPNLSSISCGINAFLPAPHNLSADVPGLNRYNFAEYLNLGDLSTCVYPTLQNPKEICLPQQDVCYTEGILRVSVVLNFADVLLTSQSLRVGNVILAEEDGDDPTNYVVRHWEEIKLKLETSASVDTASPGELAQRAELLAKTTADIHNRLAGFQQELYARVHHELTKGTLRPLVVELAGSKALLDSFVALGLSRAVANDDFLHATLFGNQQLVKDNQIIQTYTISATQPITMVNLLVNPRRVIEQTAGERSAAFSELLTKYLDAITAKTHIESPDYIANTRRMLELTVRIAHLDFPETPETPETPESPVTPEPPEIPVPPDTPAPPVTPVPPATPLPEGRNLYLPAVGR